MNNLQLAKTLISLQGNGSEVYELRDDKLFKRRKIGNTVGELIFATYEAWDVAGFHVIKGQKAELWDSGKAYFSFGQVDEHDQWYDHDQWYEQGFSAVYEDPWDFLHDDWGDRD